MAAMLADYPALMRRNVIFGSNMTRRCGSWLAILALIMLSIGQAMAAASSVVAVSGMDARISAASHVERCAGHHDPGNGGKAGSQLHAFDCCVAAGCSNVTPLASTTTQAFPMSLAATVWHEFRMVPPDSRDTIPALPPPRSAI
jgi:hypothetical protein